MYLAKTLPLCHLPRGNLYFVQGVHVSGGNTFINHIMERVFVQNYNFIWLFSIYINPEIDEGGELSPPLNCIVGFQVVFCIDVA